MITPLPVPPVPVHAAALPAASPVSTKLEKDTVYMPSSVAARLLGARPVETTDASLSRRI